MNNIIILNYVNGTVWVYDIPDNVEPIDFITSKGFRESEVSWMVTDNYMIINDERR